MQVVTPGFKKIEPLCGVVEGKRPELFQHAILRNGLNT